MKRFINSIVLLLLLIPASDLSGQDRRIIVANQQWIQHYQQIRVGDRWMLGIDGGFRWRERLGTQSQYIVRGGALYRIAEGVQAGGGIVFSGLYTNGEVAVREIRPYQEVNHSIRMGRSVFIHRFRAEQRWFNELFTDTQRFNWRLRYSVLFKLRIANLGEDGPDLLLNLSDEIFLNAGSQVIYNVFDQNRLIAGPSVRFPSTWEIGISYNYQFSGSRLPGVYGRDHVIWFTTRHTLR